MVRPQKLVRWCYALTALACVGIATSLASNFGVCVSEGKILSDKAYFKAAVDVVIRDPVDGVIEYVPGAIILKSVRSQRYADADEFFNDFPKCCKFVPANSGDSGPQLSILDRLRGVRTVEVTFDKRYADEQGLQKSASVMAKVAVTSCGNGRSYR